MSAFEKTSKSERKDSKKEGITQHFECGMFS